MIFAHGFSRPAVVVIKPQKRREIYTEVTEVFVATKPPLGIAVETPERGLAIVRLESEELKRKAGPQETPFWSLVISLRCHWSLGAAV